MSEIPQAVQEIMEKVKAHKPSPLMAAALNGNLDSYLARETIKRLEGKDTFTIKDIRNAHDDIYGVKK